AFAIRTPGTAGHRTAVASEGEDLLALLGIPHLQRLVLAAGEDAFAIRTPDTAGHRTGVALEREDLLAFLGIPHLQCVVLATGKNVFAISAPRAAGDVVEVALKNELIAMTEGPEMPMFPISEVPLTTVQQLQRPFGVVSLPFLLRLRQCAAIESQF